MVILKFPKTSQEVIQVRILDRLKTDSTKPSKKIPFF